MGRIEDIILKDIYFIRELLKEYFFLEYLGYLFCYLIQSMFLGGLNEGGFGL